MSSQRSLGKMGIKFFLRISQFTSKQEEEEKEEEEKKEEEEVQGGGELGGSPTSHNLLLSHIPS